MKQIKSTIPFVIFIFILLITTLHTFYLPEHYHAATSYTNAKEFYTSTSSDMYNHHAEMINGSIYYATSGKLAVSSSNTRYLTIGFDIELSGNGYTVSFSVQRTSTSMKEIHSCKDATHEYNLYVIDDSTLYQLARAANPTDAEKVLSASVITVKMDAILTLIENNSIKGGISEDGHGGFTYWGKIYRLMYSTDLNALKDTFTGHDFKSYYNINEELPNYQLNILYNLQGLNTTSSSTITVAKGYGVLNNYLAIDNTIYIQQERILQQISLINPYDIKLKKTGYHLENESEWITEDHRIFTNSTTYMPKTLDSLVGITNREITLYANWYPNQYVVVYDSNGGSGSVPRTVCYYDTETLLSKNTFHRTGYKLKDGEEWNTKKDGTGTSYSTEQVVSNLCSENNVTITLYANWEPKIYTITLAKFNGKGGTDIIYEKYGIGYFSNKKCTKPISTISSPILNGHSFTGYYRTVTPSKNPIIDANGTIQTNNTFFESDTTIYAHFAVNTYNIKFDKQGGRSDIGTDSTSVNHGEYFPKATAPIKDGYSFQGYFTQKNGSGIQHYNKYMASSGVYPYTNDITLFAYWADETLPTVTLNANFDSWTNQPIHLTATATDKGVGLKSLMIYRIAENGTLTSVASNTSCDGSSTATLSYTNTTEGIIRYMAVATDINNQTSTSYQAVYYDTTTPRGEITKKTLNSNSIFFELNVTDVKVR